MDEQSKTAGHPQGTAGAGRWLRWSLYALVLAALATTSLASFRLSQERARAIEAENRLGENSGIVALAPKRLSAEYSDKHGRLLADPPSDPAKLIDPPSLVLAYRVDTESDGTPVAWEDLGEQLAKATGKPVAIREYSGSVDDVAQVKSGQIHLVALHSADTPYLVNHAGFIPIGVLGNEGGANGNRLDVAVRPSSKIQKLADLKGHKLTFTRPDSITGYRAAVAALQQIGIRPYADYAVLWSFGQAESIRGLVEGEFEAAALSDDKLQGRLKKGRLDKSDLRIIFQSQVIPHLTIGHVYNLKPELATQIASVIFAFDNAQATPEESTGKPMRFFATDYKKDFEFVRKIDESFDPRFSQRIKERQGAEPAQADPDADAPDSKPEQADKAG